MDFFWLFIIEWVYGSMETLSTISIFVGTISTFFLVCLFFASGKEGFLKDEHGEWECPHLEEKWKLFLKLKVVAIVSAAFFTFCILLPPKNAIYTYMVGDAVTQIEGVEQLPEKTVKMLNKLADSYLEEE